MTPVPVAVRSIVPTYSRSTVGNTVSNSTEGKDIRFLCLLCAWNVAASVIADRAFRGVLLAVCTCVI